MMIAATPATRRPLIVNWDSLELLRKFAEAIRTESPGMLPAEARQAAQILWATGYRVDDYGKVVATR